MKNGVDEKLVTALQDVPVPEGFAERLLERLRNEEQRTENEELPRPSSSLPVPRLSRWWLWAACGLAATAAGLLIAVWLGTHKGEYITEQFALDEAIRSFDVDLGEPGPLLAERPAPAGYPFSLAVAQVRGTRWRLLEAFLGHRGVVYSLPGPAGTSAALYVVDAEGLEGFRKAPSLHPYTTAGCCASSWEEGGLLYVLVVQGDPATYRAYLNLSHEPVA